MEYYDLNEAVYNAAEEQYDEYEETILCDCGKEVEKGFAYCANCLYCGLYALSQAQEIMNENAGLERYDATNLLKYIIENQSEMEEWQDISW